MQPGRPTVWSTTFALRSGHFAAGVLTGPAGNVWKVCLFCEARRRSLWLAELAKSFHEATADGSSGLSRPRSRNEQTQMPQPNDPRPYAESAGLSHAEASRTGLGPGSRRRKDHARRIFGPVATVYALYTDLNLPAGTVRVALLESAWSAYGSVVIS